jgi:hypothetical protein
MMLTIFSAPKAFNDEHIARIQRNAIRSWIALGNDVEVILLGDESGLMEVAEDFGVGCIPVHTRSSSGAPLINELFALACQHAMYSILCYVNADIIFMDDFIPSIQSTMEIFKAFLIVGNRYDLSIEEELQMKGEWIEEIRQSVHESGRLHPPMGSDYFIFAKGQFADMPPFALGRAGWDNWMMYKARFEGVPVVDASRRITAIHQDHDYAHLPGGEPHYRHPESLRNIQLAGGYEMMFRLRDANWVMSPGGIRRKRMREWEWPRKIEADLIARFGIGFRSRLTRMIFHPLDTLAYFRSKVAGTDRMHMVEDTSEREVSA